MNIEYEEENYAAYKKNVDRSYICLYSALQDVFEPYACFRASTLRFR